MNVGRLAPLLCAVALLALFSIPVEAQTDLPVGWIKTAPPLEPWDLENSKHMCAVYSHTQWGVRAGSEGQIQVSNLYKGQRKNTLKAVFPPKFVRTKEMVGAPTVVRAGDGWLIGFNGGEFGGGLWWSNRDGSQTTLLDHGNVRVIIVRSLELLVFSGLAHLGTDLGQIYSYRPATNKPGDLVPLVDLGSAPNAAVLQSDGTLLVATQKGVLKMDSENHIRQLYQHEYMRMMYPDSIVGGRDESVFVGMRFYVLQLQARPDGSYEGSWFMRSDCSKFKIKDYDCICEGKLADN